MSADPTFNPQNEATSPRSSQKLGAILLALTALLVLAFCASFALPAVNGGPDRIPIGVTGPQASTGVLQKTLNRNQWDVTVYKNAGQLTSAVKDRDVAGGLAVTPAGLDVYTATAGSPMAGTALTAMGSAMAAQQKTTASVHDLVPFPKDDPHGAGFAAAAQPMVLGGLVFALILTRVAPGRRGRVHLRPGLTGALAASLLVGLLITAFLQYGTGSLTGNYWITALGLTLGMAALTLTFAGLDALFGATGIGVGALVMMLLGIPLTGLGTGPYWLPSGWSTLGQLLPPGAAGSLTRANAFFDGGGAGGPALVLTFWVLLGAALLVVATLRSTKTSPAEVEAGERREPATA